MRADEGLGSYGFDVDFKPCRGSDETDSSWESGRRRVEQAETTTGGERQSAYLPTHELDAGGHSPEEQTLWRAGQRRAQTFTPDFVVEQVLAVCREVLQARETR
jgi:hypothetical protein